MGSVRCVEYMNNLLSTYCSVVTSQKMGCKIGEQFVDSEDVKELRDGKIHERSSTDHRRM